MIPIKSDKSHAVVSVYKGLHVIYTNKTLIKAKIYSSYSINEVKAGQTYIKRQTKQEKKKGQSLQWKENPYYLFFLPLGLSPVAEHCYTNTSIAM